MEDLEMKEEMNIKEEIVSPSTVEDTCTTEDTCTAKDIFTAEDTYTSDDTCTGEDTFSIEDKCTVYIKEEDVKIETTTIKGKDKIYVKLSIVVVVCINTMKTTFIFNFKFQALKQQRKADIL